MEEKTQEEIEKTPKKKFNIYTTTCIIVLAVLVIVIIIQIIIMCNLNSKIDDLNYKNSQLPEISDEIDENEETNNNLYEFTINNQTFFKK